MLKRSSVKHSGWKGPFSVHEKKRIGFSKRSARWTKKGGCWISVGNVRVLGGL